MSLFLTKYNAMVGGKYTDGEVRVYRQYVSVLTQGVTANNVTGNANNTLTLTDSAAWARGLSVSDTLNLSDSAAWIAEIGVTDTLALVDGFVAEWIHNVSVEDTLNLQDVGAKGATFASASNVLGLSDYFLEEYIVEDRKLASNTLSFSQTVLTLSSIQLSHTLNLTQTATVYNTSRRVSASDHLFLYEYLPTTHRQWIEDDLTLSDIGRVPITYSVTHTLNLVDVASMSDVDGVLSFVQTVTVGKSKTTSSTLNLNHAVVVTGVFMRSVVDDLGIGHAFTWVEDSPCNRKSYSPFYGENTIPGAVLPPSASLPIVQGNPVSDRFLLYTPARGARTTTVTLRAPELDNRDRNAYTRVARETRGGKLYVYADPNWPKVRTMVVTVIGLLKTDVESYQAFLQSTLGQEIGVTDWEGRQWAGVIVNPDEPITQDGKDMWTITFSLEGELLEGYHPGTGNDSALALTDSATYTVV
jgi:hypothetical protein